MNTILLVEDNKAIIMGLSYLFKENGYKTIVAENIGAARSELAKSVIDIVILDVMLPDGDGFSLCRYIKDNDIAPVIFLTARDEEKDVVLGLELGADDYIVKPFRNLELLSRIKNVLRRNANSTQLNIGSLRIDTDARRVYIENNEISITKLEFEILKIMAGNPKRVFTREEILSYIWDSAGNFVNDNTLTVTIKRLREKLGDKDGKLIVTVRGVGYKIGVWDSCLQVKE